MADQVKKVLARLSRKEFELVEALFERAAQEQKIKIDARAAAIGIIGLSDGLWLDLAIGVDGFTRDDAVRACLDYIDGVLDDRHAKRRHGRLR